MLLSTRYPCSRHLIRSLFSLLLAITLALALEAEARADEGLPPGAVLQQQDVFEVFLDPAGHVLQAALGTAFLGNLLRDQIVAAVAQNLGVAPGVVSAKVDFVFKQDAENMPINVTVFVGKVLRGNFDLGVTCSFSLRLSLKQDLVTKARFDYPFDINNDGLPNCENSLNKALGPLKNVPLPLVLELLKKRVHLDLTGFLVSLIPALSIRLLDDEGTKNLDASYFFSAVKDVLYVGAHFCRTGTTGDAVCIQLVWPPDREREILASTLAAVPAPEGPSQGIPDALIKAWRDAAATTTCPSLIHPDTLYPAKGTKCDMDDMVLYAGLLCLSGETADTKRQIADPCTMVKEAQEVAYPGDTTVANDGRWWRSPHHVESLVPESKTDISPDSRLGIFAYLASDNAPLDQRRWAYYHWRNYLIRNKERFPPTGEPSIEIARACPPQKKGNTCLTYGTPWLLLEAVENKYKWERDYEVNFDNKFRYSTDLLPFLALENEPDYHSHLIGVEIYILRALGIDDDNTKLAARILAGKQPNNPFYLWLVIGKDKAVEKRVTDYCRLELNTGDKDEWIWAWQIPSEKTDHPTFWECIFMANLLKT